MFNVASPSDLAIAAIEAGLAAHFAGEIAVPVRPVMGPHDIGTLEWRAFVSAQHARAMSDACRLMCEGASPADVAGFVLSLGIVGGGVSRAIEDQAFPGTFAEAVFNILAD